MGLIPTFRTVRGEVLRSPSKNQDASGTRGKAARMGERASHDFGTRTWELGTVRLKCDGGDGKRGLLPSGELNDRRRAYRFDHIKSPEKG